MHLDVELEMRLKEKSDYLLPVLGKEPPNGEAQ
jgi:hypothetical protein